MNREIWHSMIPRIPRRPVGLKTSKNRHESSVVASFMADAGYVSWHGPLILEKEKAT